MTIKKVLKKVKVNLYSVFLFRINSTKKLLFINDKIMHINEPEVNFLSADLSSRIFHIRDYLSEQPQLKTQ